MPARQPGKFPVLAATRADNLACTQTQSISVSADAATAGRATFRGRCISHLQLALVRHGSGARAHVQLDRPGAVD